VQADATGLGLREVLVEITGLGQRPVNSQELKFAQESAMRSLPGEFESVLETAAVTARLFALDLPLSHFSTLPARYAAVTTADVLRTTRRVLRPEAVQVLLVGERTAIDAAMKDRPETLTWLDATGRRALGPAGLAHPPHALRSTPVSHGVGR
jgi:zinc protease